MRMLHY